MVSIFSALCLFVFGIIVGALIMMRDSRKHVAEIEAIYERCKKGVDSLENARWESYLSVTEYIIYNIDAGRLRSVSPELDKKFIDLLQSFNDSKGQNVPTLEPQGNANLN